jgi:hypothetical protein
MRDGVLWAPVTGEVLATSILNGVPDPVLAPYDPARFARQGVCGKRLSVGTAPPRRLHLSATGARYSGR